MSSQFQWDSNIMDYQLGYSEIWIKKCSEEIGIDDCQSCSCPHPPSLPWKNTSRRTSLGDRASQRYVRTRMSQFHCWNQCHECKMTAAKKKISMRRNILLRYNETTLCIQKFTMSQSAQITIITADRWIKISDSRKQLSYLSSADTQNIETIV